MAKEKERFGMKKSPNKSAEVASCPIEVRFVRTTVVDLINGRQADSSVVGKQLFLALEHKR